MQALANSGAFWVLLMLVLCVIYLLPTIIAVIRGVDQLALVFLVNLIGGLAVVGWPAAMILAFGPRRLPPEPPPPWPACPRGDPWRGPGGW
jgi:Superinfection immunity protein